jgi:hypothetical protein
MGGFGARRRYACHVQIPVKDLNRRHLRAAPPARGRPSLLPETAGCATARALGEELAEDVELMLDSADLAADVLGAGGLNRTKLGLDGLAAGWPVAGAGFAFADAGAGSELVERRLGEGFGLASESSAGVSRIAETPG